MIMYNVYGVMCDTYEDACRVAGIETPAQLALEEAYYAELALLEEISHLHGPIPNLEWCDCSRQRISDIPF